MKKTPPEFKEFPFCGKYTKGMQSEFSSWWNSIRGLWLPWAKMTRSKSSAMGRWPLNWHIESDNLCKTILHVLSSMHPDHHRKTPYLQRQKQYKQHTKKIYYHRWNTGVQVTKKLHKTHKTDHRNLPCIKWLKQLMNYNSNASQTEKNSYCSC